LINKPEEIKKIEKYQSYYAEPKYDGIRCFLQNTNGKIDLIREDGNVKTNQFPEIVNNTFLPENTILDGEICILKNELSADFFTILTRQTTDPKRVKILSEKIPATFMAFDMHQVLGSNTLKETIEQRRELMRQHIMFNSKLKMIQQFEPAELFPKIKEFDMEGMVLKPKNSTYLESWKKYKNYEERDFTVVGYTKSETKSICAFNLIDENGQDVGKVSNTKLPNTKDNELWLEKNMNKSEVVDRIKGLVASELDVNLKVADIGEDDSLFEDGLGSLVIIGPVELEGLSIDFDVGVVSLV